MRDIIGLLVGLYLTVALVVVGGGAYAFMTNATARSYDCPAFNLAVTAGVANGKQGSPNWLPYALLRGAAWPYFFATEQQQVGGSIPNWLLVKYDPFPKSCGG